MNREELQDQLTEIELQCAQMKLKFLYYLGGITIIATIIIVVVQNDLRAHLTKCQESVLGTESAVGRCDYPARIMRVKGVWICSCRSERETKRGIE